MKFKKIIIPVLATTAMLTAYTPADIYKINCSSCHGANGENNALGMSKPLQGISVDEFMSSINGFASGDKEGAPVAKMVKKSFVQKYSQEEIKAVGEYLNQIK